MYSHAWLHLPDCPLHYVWYLPMYLGTVDVRIWHWAGAGPPADTAEPPRAVACPLWCSRVAPDQKLRTGVAVVSGQDDHHNQEQRLRAPPPPTTCRHGCMTAQAYSYNHTSHDTASHRLLSLPLWLAGGPEGGVQNSRPSKVAITKFQHRPSRQPSQSFLTWAVHGRNACTRYACPLCLPVILPSDGHPCSWSSLERGRMKWHGTQSIAFCLRRIRHLTQRPSSKPSFAWPIPRAGLISASSVSWMPPADSLTSGRVATRAGISATSLLSMMPAGRSPMYGRRA